MVIKSINESQHQILENIRTLYCKDGFDADISYGNGSFYKYMVSPDNKFDIDPQLPDVIKACSTELPVVDGAFQSVVFDPPFLTYIKNGRGHSDGKGIMSGRFGGYWTYDELEKHYRSTLVECSRVIVNGGILVFKCQDIIHNHRMFCTHNNVIEWARSVGFRLEDLFVLLAKNRLPTREAKHGVQTQRHARIFHSYFLVFRRIKMFGTDTGLKV